MISNILLLATGALVGSHYGNRVAELLSDNNRMYVIKQLKKNLVNSKAFIKKYHKDIILISSIEDLNKCKLSWFMRRKCRSLLSELPDNMFYINPSAKRPAIIIAASRANPDVLGHELGHHRDYLESRKRPLRRLSGVLVQEKAAWDRSPYMSKKKNVLKHHALQIYKKHSIGLFVGMAIGVAIGVMVCDDLDE